MWIRYEKYLYTLLIGIIWEGGGQLDVLGTPNHEIITPKCFMLICILIVIMRIE